MPERLPVCSRGGNIGPLAPVRGAACLTLIARRGTGVDVLSEVLKLVTFTGPVFYNADSPSWSVRPPASPLIAQYFGRSAAHVIVYHLLTEGSAWIEMEKGRRLELSPGDIVIFPHGHPHVMGNGPPRWPTGRSWPAFFREGWKSPVWAVTARSRNLCAAIWSANAR